MTISEVFGHISSMSLSPTIFLCMYLLGDDWRVPKWVYFLTTALIGPVGELIRYTPINVTLRIAIILVLDALLLLSFTKVRGSRFFFSCATSIAVVLKAFTLGIVLSLQFQTESLPFQLFFLLLVLLAAWRFFRPVFLPIYRVQSNIWRWLVLLPVSLLALYLALLMDFDTLAFSTGTLLLTSSFALLTVLSYYVLFRFFYFQQQQQGEKLDNLLLSTQFDELKKQVNRAQAEDERNRILRHDMRHYLRTLSLCLENGELERAQEMLTLMEHFPQKPPDAPKEEIPYGE